jgi:uncharacterized protein with LGFP repeats
VTTSSATIVEQGDIAAGWLAAGGFSSAAGAPTSAQVCGLAAGGCLERFVNGSYYWSPSTGAHFVPSGSMAAWGSVGYEFGTVGYPINESVAASGGGSTQAFQHGTLVISAAGSGQFTH